LPVYGGAVDVTIPITATANVLNWALRDKPDSLDLGIDVRYQVCSDIFVICPSRSISP